VRLPAGHHRWQVTAGLPVPNAPVMVRTENRSGGAKVVFSPVAGATRYRVELSRDNGATWNEAGTSSEPGCDLSGLPNGSKVHVRAVALNDQQHSEPADEYPLYVSSEAPLPPDGLKVQTAKDTVKLTWGQVLGVTEYRLYRRVQGTEKYTLVYQGQNREYTDRAAGVIPAFELPGARANVMYNGPAYPIYEYALAAVNGNGEGKMGVAVNTDPASWLIWDPKPGERFRRRFNYGSMMAEVGEEQKTDRYYPK
jgi:hypothetical protein